MHFILMLFSLMLISVLSFGQSDNNKQKSSTSLQPYYPEEQKASKKVKKKSKQGPTFESEQEYYDRLAKVYKDKKKAEKEMMKPQYSNPMYLGHKRPPKKNKAGKLKFCKECGIRH